MQTTQTTGSATILTFPAGGRFAPGLLRSSAHAAALATPSRPIVDTGAWYHAEAVADAKPARTR